MTSGRLTIIERLELCAQKGKVSKRLNLYLRQEKDLAKQGFDITRLHPVPKHHGQNSCLINWGYAEVDTEAHRLFLIAEEHNEQTEGVSTLNPPYYY